MEWQFMMLFDYQRFEGNKDLQDVIDSVRERVDTFGIKADETDAQGT